MYNNINALLKEQVEEVFMLQLILAMGMTSIGTYFIYKKYEKSLKTEKISNK